MSHFNYKNNILFAERISIPRLAKSYVTPFYCYSLSQIEKNFLTFKKKFKKINPIICFALKANSNLTLLKKLNYMGAGADVVSLGELIKALKAGINPKKIVFSGVGKTENEIEIAIKKKILLINVESESEAFLINKISKKLGKKTSIGIRLNPNVVANTNKKISTGGKNDKFGLVYIDFLRICNQIVKMKNLKIEGLSVHIGSQITNLKPFKNVLNIINKIIKKTKINFKFIDLGGGMGIAYSNKEKALDLKKYASIVNSFIKNKKVKIIFEPGRYVVGNAAILVTKIIYIKKNNHNKFIILDAGMNDLMRPALYNSSHRIIPVKKTNKKIFGNIEFVGPICESSDKFLNKKNFFKIKEGDFLAITDVGAYGASLSSNYNVRPKIAEIMINGTKTKLISKRQSLENLINN